MKAELLNLSLFVSAIAKVLLMTGVAAAPLLALAIRVRGGFWAPVAIGKVYRVERHYLGDFVCEILDVDRDLARIRVTDPMRPIPIAVVLETWVQEMRHCEKCGGPQIFVLAWEFEGGRVGCCLGCGDERIERFTRATSEAA